MVRLARPTADDARRDNFRQERCCVGRHCVRLPVRGNLNLHDLYIHKDVPSTHIERARYDFLDTPVLILDAPSDVTVYVCQRDMCVDNPPALSPRCFSGLGQEGHCVQGCLAHEKLTPLGPCSRPIPRALWWPWGVGVFMSEVLPVNHPIHFDAWTFHGRVRRPAMAGLHQA